MIFKDIIQKYVTYKITSGEWKPGDVIDSENKLAYKFGCSRLTTRNALIPLVNLGIISPQKGKGYVVSEDSEEEFLSSTSKFLGATKTEAREYKNNVTSYFNLKNNDKFFAVEKKYFVGNRIVGYQVTLLNKWYVWELNLKEIKKSITNFVAKQGGPIFNNKIQIFFGKMDILDEHAKQLKLDLNLYPIQRITSYSKETWIEKTICIISKDKFRFTFTKYKY